MLKETNLKKDNSLDLLWEKSNESFFISQLRKGQAPHSIIESQYSPDRAVAPYEIQCSDGRCPHHGNELSIAGSGILLSDAEFKAMIEQNPSLRVLTSHSECGAGKLAFAKAQAAGTVPAGIDNAEDFTKDWTMKKAAQYGLEYRHIGVEEFVNPLHHERGIVVDATGRFHPSLFEGMPNMFISQAASFAGKEYIGAEADILTSIGTGDHAFGPRIDSENPFLILVAAEEPKTKDELVKIIKTSTERYGDKVRVEGLLASEKLS